MGDVSIASLDAWSFSPRNPALLGQLPAAGLHFSAATEFNRLSGAGASATRVEGFVPLLWGATPLVGGLVGAVSLCGLTDGRYEIAQEIEGDPTSYTLHTRGKGGWTQLGLSLARGIGVVSLGVQLEVPFGNLTEEVTREFASSDYVERQEKIETLIEDAILLTFGGHVRQGRVSAGVFTRLSSQVDVTTRHKSTIGEIEYSRSLEVPVAYGAGAAFQLTPRLVVSGEWRRQAWTDARLGSPVGADLEAFSIPKRKFEDVGAWGAGLQWVRGSERKRSVSGGMRLRAGYGHAPWNMKGPYEGRVTDRTITAGVGIPFRDEFGVIDAAVRYTMRREDGGDLRENVLGFVFGLSFSKRQRAY